MSIIAKPLTGVNSQPLFKAQPKLVQASVEALDAFYRRQVIFGKILPRHYIDAEWEDGWPYGCLQAYEPHTGRLSLIFHPRAIEIHSQSTLQTIADEYGAQIVIGHGELTPYAQFSPHHGSHTELCMFYSPKDLRIAIGDDVFLEAIKNGLITQGRRLAFSPTDLYLSDLGLTPSKPSVAHTILRLNDLNGLANGGLAGYAAASGIVLPKETVNGVDIDKTRMMSGLFTDHPEVFIRYAVGDVVGLYMAHLMTDDYIREILRDTLCVDYPDTQRLPGTVGALVAMAFERWIHSLHPDLELALNKLGRLSPGMSSTKAEKLRRERQETWKLWRDGVDTQALTEAIARHPMETTGLSEASSQTFGRRRDTGAYLAGTQGGRAVNEKPYQYTIGLGADIDLSSCYGTALTAYTYPLGIPTVLAETQSRGLNLTLGEFLAKYEAHLVPGLWQVVVSGGLPFPQDLVFSKRTTIAKINRAMGRKGDDDAIDNDIAHVPGDFALTRRHIELGIITADILEAIRAVSTNHEWRGWLGLRVEAAAFYDKRHRVTDIDTWVAAIKEHDGTHGLTSDTRSNLWVGIPISGFINPLLDERKKLKGRKKTASSPDEQRFYDNRQKLVKLFVNTLYGVLASPFFPVGNTIVTNNITARARRGAWMMAKALGSVQSITDGGAYSLNHVRYLAPWAYKPGFAILAEPQNWLNPRKGRYEKPLGDIDWEQRLTELTEATVGAELDTHARAHLDEFWQRYGLQMQFDIEHKGSNTFSRLAYWNKADYGLRQYYGGGIVLRVRGERYNLADLSHDKTAPKVTLLINILNGSDEARHGDDCRYVKTHLVKIGEYLIRVRNDPKYPLPGDEHSDKPTGYYRNTHIPLDSYRDYDRLNHRRRAPGFNYYAPQGIRVMHQAMLADKFKTPPKDNRSKPLPN